MFFFELCLLVFCTFTLCIFYLRQSRCQKENQILDLTRKFETLLRQEKLEKCKQAVIPDIFKKQI